MADEPHEEPLTRTGVLRAELGQFWKGWIWLARQFNPTSLSALGAVIVACGGYIIHLREDVAKTTERVVVLETKVIPVIGDENRVTMIETKVADHDQRITRLEDNYDTAQREAGRAPIARRRHP